MDLAKRHTQILRIAVQPVPLNGAVDERLAVPIVGATTVADADIEHAVRPEGDVTAVVVDLRPA